MITFAIPFYSDLALLRRALETALSQTLGDVRVIVIDDCGPESAAELVRSLRDHRVSYACNPRNLGLAGNWNACLDAASTDLVTLLHADDELLPNYAQLMTTAAARWPDATALFCQARIIGPDSRLVFSLPDYVKRFLIPSVRRPVVIAGEPGLTRLLRGNFIMCPTLCYRKSRLQDRRFSRRWRMVLDLEFTAGLLLAGERLVGLPDVAYAYRRHPSNQTSQLTASLVRFQEEVALLDELRDRSRTLHWRRASFAARQKVMVSLNLAYCVLTDLAHLRPRSAWSKLCFLRGQFGV
jgi:glycosyltransferase involved in cell wall biosynthesis